MHQEHIAYLHARELESYFREKVDLRYKGENGNFSEYEVTHVNNRPVKQPISVGFSASSSNTHLYISADLTQLKQGTAKIEFDLSGDKLHGLETGKHKIKLLDALQTSTSNRFLINAEDIAGQSLLHSIDREYKKTITNPFHQLRDLFQIFTGTYPDGPFGKPIGDTVKQSKPMHMSYNVNRWSKTNLGLHNTNNEHELDHTIAGNPILVRTDDVQDLAQLTSGAEYELTFSRYSNRGELHQQCVFTPKDPDVSRAVPFRLEYDGIKITDTGFVLHLPSGRSQSFHVSDPERAQDWDISDIVHKEQHDRNHALDRSDSFVSSKTSLDSRIASAQTRSRQQTHVPTNEHNQTIPTGHER